MSQATDAAIAAILASTLPNSISPATLANVLTLLQTDVANGDTTLNQSITALGTRTTTAEGGITSLGTRMTAAEGALQNHATTIQNQGSTISQHTSSITAQAASISALQQKTLTTADPITGPSRLEQVHDCIPFYVDDIDTYAHPYAKQIVNIKNAANVHVDLSKVDFEETEILIDCSDDYNIEAELTRYYIKFRQGASFKMVAGNSYRLSLFRILDTTRHQTYSASDVEYYAILIKL